MKKKVFALFLAVLMATSTLLTGCGSNNEVPHEPDVNVQEQENQNQNNPGNPNQGEKTQYIKDGKFVYIEAFPLHVDPNNGEISFYHYIPVTDAIINELKAHNPDAYKTTIRNTILGLAYIENVSWEGQSDRELKNGDVVTVEVCIVQDWVDEWNKSFGDIELVIEPTYTYTVEGLPE